MTATSAVVGIALNADASATTLSGSLALSTSLESLCTTTIFFLNGNAFSLSLLICLLRTRITVNRQFDLAKDLWSFDLFCPDILDHRFFFFLRFFCYNRGFSYRHLLYGLGLCYF